MGSAGLRSYVIDERWSAMVAGRPGAVALLDDGVPLTRGELDRDVDACRDELGALGVSPGDRVGIHLQNTVPCVALCLAIWRIGAAVVWINPMYRDRELVHVLGDAQPRGVVTDDLDIVTAAVADRCWVRSPGHFATSPDGERATHADARTPEPDSPAMVVYTSGTTGPPKGAVVTHRNALEVVDRFGAGAAVDEHDVVLAMAPFFHITGAVLNLLIALVRGAALSVIGRFDPEAAVTAFRRDRVTFTVGSITAYNAMAQVSSAQPASFASTRALYSGGAPIPPALVERLEGVFGHYIHNVWGMTETSSAAVAVPLGQRAPVDRELGALSIGRPLAGITVRVIDERGGEVRAGEAGELEVAGPTIVAGYLNQPEATAAAMPGGRMRTGDVVRIVDGWVYIVDRLKDQINVSGYKVWPREVEDVLYTHPAVREAAVVGVPDDYRGESVVAYVSLTSGSGSAALAAELQELVRGQLAAYKRPRRILFADELPKTATGKIQRARLRQEHAGS